MALEGRLPSWTHHTALAAWALALVLAASLHGTDAAAAALHAHAAVPPGDGDATPPLHPTKPSLMRSEASPSAASALELQPSASAGASAAAFVNPMSATRLERADGWSLLEGLFHEIKLEQDAVVLAHFQVTAPGAWPHFFTRLLLNDLPVDGARSGMGNMDHLYNFGFYASQLRAGHHTFRVQYRVGSAVNMSEDGDFWETRALNVLALPQAEVTGATALWSFPLFAGGVYVPVPGLSQDVQNVFGVVLAAYSFVSEGQNSFISAKLFMDEEELPMSRSVAAETRYVQLSGFYVGKPRRYSAKFTVKYRIDVPGVEFPQADWTTRALTVVDLPEAEVHTATSQGTYELVQSAGLQTFPFLSKDIYVAAPRYVLATFNIATRCHTKSYGSTDDYADVFSALYINDVEQKQTRSRVGKTRYCQNIGMWMGYLPGGSHNFQVKYRVSQNMYMPGGQYDWGTVALNIVVLSPLGTALLQESSAAAVADSSVASSSSLVDLGHLEKVAALEKQVKDGRAPAELLRRLDRRLAGTSHSKAPRSRTSAKSERSAKRRGAERRSVRRRKESPMAASTARLGRGRSRGAAHAHRGRNQSGGRSRSSRGRKSRSKSADAD